MQGGKLARKGIGKGDQARRCLPRATREAEERGLKRRENGSGPVEESRADKHPMAERRRREKDVSTTAEEVVGAQAR